MRKMHKEGYVKVLKMILKTKLTPKNKILAINQIAIPKIQYSFGIIDWPENCYANTKPSTKIRATEDCICLYPKSKRWHGPD